MTTRWWAACSPTPWHERPASAAADVGAVLDCRAGTGVTERVTPWRTRAVTSSRPPPAVRYQPGGGVLVAGPGERAVPIARALGAVPGLKTLALVTGLPANGADLPRTVSVAAGRLVGVAGCLGRFSAQAASGGGPVDLAPLSPNRSGLFDVVVDLNIPALWPTEVTPLGYFAPAGDGVPVPALVREVAVLAAGETTKPCYVRYRAAACSHSAKGVTGCSRCLDACPAGAIASAGATITVDTGLCRGCGSCTATCPTGALGYTAPRSEELRGVVRGLLADCRDAGGGRVCVVFHEAEATQAAGPETEQAVDTSHLLVEVAAIASVGTETWFWALALGAAEVVLRVPPQMPATALRTLEHEVRVARVVLGALGTSPDRLRLLAPGEGTAGVPPPAFRRGAPPVRPPPPEADKRTVIEWAMSSLAGPGRAGAPRTALPPGAAYGVVAVDGTRCTGCLACTHLCPTGALAGAAGLGELRFLEGRCVQCGLCEAGCPEKAIRLAPSIGADRDARLEPAVLHRAELAPCTTCGEPFLPLALLRASLAHLGGADAVGNAEVSRAVGMCPRCRSASTMHAPFIDGAERSR